jgi:hypothetical protein
VRQSRSGPRSRGRIAAGIQRAFRVKNRSKVGGASAKPPCWQSAFPVWFGDQSMAKAMRRELRSQSHQPDFEALDIYNRMSAPTGAKLLLVLILLLLPVLPEPA